MKYKVIYRGGVFMLTKKNRLVSDASVESTFKGILAHINVSEPFTVLELDFAAFQAVEVELNGK